MTQNDDVFSKTVSLLTKEAGLTTTCLEQGLTALRKADFTQKWNYYQAFFLLTIGIERLMKLTIITLSRKEKDQLPNNGELKKYGHKINSLFTTLLTRIDPDNEFLKDDELNLMILNFLTEFASSSRYYNLDSLSGLERNDDPLHKWKDILNIIEQRHCEPRKLSVREQAMIQMISQKTSVIHTDEYDNPITNYSNLFEQGLNIDKVQGYSVLYVHRLIRTCVELLESAGKEKYLLPRFSEFFVLFNVNNQFTDSQIRNRKNWNYLSLRR
ncbi:MAG: hypothetical protein ACI8Q1_003849 [Parvicella sp.]|jgi:hypothetical protein